ncbi:MAG: acetyl-CoA carboxylase biotin carboxyl carrier protein [Planctomycetota bacterium]|nr:acetyl-CoA carboxylase biotin carboxyl carrier protein [Planctomycetota bacterium]
MIDIRKLKELVRLMVANDLTELDLRDSEEQVTLRRDGLNQVPQVVGAAGAPPASAATAGPSTPASASKPMAAPEAAAEQGLATIESPMVGTFYAASNPDSSPFVAVGSSVDPDTVVCMIEAMKIFNEIKAECSGTIEKVLVNNGESIEFGQALFIVRPS